MACGECGAAIEPGDAACRDCGGPALTAAERAEWEIDQQFRERIIA